MALNQRPVKSQFFLVMESKTPQEGFEEITVEHVKTKQPITKYIRKFSDVTGFVKKLEWRDTKDQFTERYRGFRLTLIDPAADEEYILDLPFDSIPYRQFVKYAENIDFTKPVMFCAWHDKRNDQVAFRAKQDDKIVLQAFTKDNPNGMPQPEMDDLDKLDFKNQNIWLRRRILEKVIPMVEAAEGARSAVNNLADSVPGTPSAPPPPEPEAEAPQGEFDYLDDGDPPF